MSVHDMHNTRIPLHVSTFARDQDCTQVSLRMTTATCIYVCTQLLLHATTFACENAPTWNVTCLPRMQARITPSLTSHNPNASRMDERLVQLTWTDGQTTQTAKHDDNPEKNFEVAS